MSVFSREHLNSWYGVKAYYLAKILTDIPFQIILPIIYISIVYWMSAQPNDLFRFGYCILSAVLTSQIGQSTGMFFGALTNVQSAVFLAIVAVMPMLLFSGFFISISSLPSYLRWLAYISYLKYGLRSSVIAIYGFKRPLLECKKLFCFYMKPSLFLKARGITKEDIWTDFIALIVFLVILKILTYIIISWKVKRKH